MDKKISVIVPVHNSEKTLDKCVQSILDNTYKNLEIILVQNGSNDNSWQKCEAWQKKDSRVMAINLKDKAGISIARNTGLKNMTGDYFAFVDADDSVDITTYEKLLAKAEETNADMTFCKYYSVNVYKSKTETEVRNEPLLSMAVESKSPIHIGYYIWRILYKAETLKNVRFIESLKFSEDVAFIYECLAKSKKCALLDEPLYYYTNIYTNKTTFSRKYNLQKDAESNRKTMAEVIRNTYSKMATQTELNAALYELWVSFNVMVIKSYDNIKQGLKHINSDPFWNEIKTKENYKCYKKVYKDKVNRVKGILVRYKFYNILKLLLR